VLDPPPLQPQIATRVGKELLEIVQDQQRQLVAQVFQHCVHGYSVAGEREAERLHYRRGDHLRIADGGQRDEVDAVRKLVGRLGRNLEAEAGLADSARAGQREQARALQQLLRPRDHVGAADKARQLRGQVVGRAVERPESGEGRRNPPHN